MPGSDVNSKFIYQAVVFAVAVLFLTPVLFNMFFEKADGEEEVADDRINSLLADYNNFTGTSQNITQEQPWALSGIYTPYLGGAYNYTPDMWLYGSQMGIGEPYLPSQYEDTPLQNTDVSYDATKGAYYYNQNTFDGHKAGDLYTAVTMDVNQKSDIFFTSSGNTLSCRACFASGLNMVQGQSVLL